MGKQLIYYQLQSLTCRLAMSSGNLAYTTLASWVSISDSTNIFPILILLQQSRNPCSMASPDLTMETPQLPDLYFKPLYEPPVGVITLQSVNVS